MRSGSFQSQSQNGGQNHVQQQASHGGQGNSDQQQGNFGQASLFVPPAPGSSGGWWPADLRWPNSTGAQNNVRYAYFAQAHRLVIDLGGTVTVYDTLDHQIGGFSQQQSVGGTLSFSSQYGLMDVSQLPVISSNGLPPQPLGGQVSGQIAAPAELLRAANMQTPAREASAAPSLSATAGGCDQDIFASIERLADLKAKGIFSDGEFSAKKAELLSRL